MKDGLGRTMNIGDVVELWSDYRGHVVCSFDDNQFSPSYPRSEWGYLKHGALIVLDNGQVFHYEMPDEDLKIVRQAATTTG